MVQGDYPVPAQYGDRVMYRSSTFGRGVGTFYLCWLGIAEVWEVRRDDGTKVSLFPCFGDAMLAIRWP